VPSPARRSRALFAAAASHCEAGGRVWRKRGGYEEIVELGPGISLTLPTGTHFQFRCDGDEPLNAIGATMPPWPGESEAFFVDGTWEPTV
jgi:mannose-6-phosphate isomerase-like protein (cupin superfamily)